MLISAAKKVAWMARTTTTVVGLAIMLALVLGVATTALAGTGVGARFDLGKVNTVDAVTSLVGNVAGPSFQIDNNSTGTGATALDLQVEPGNAPMKVNSDTKVANLSVDEVDGKSANEIGVNGVTRATSVSPASSSSSKTVTAFCPTGKVVVGTGYDIVGGISGNFPTQQTDVVVSEVEPFSNATRVTAYEEEPSNTNWSVTAYAICATAP